MPQGVYQRKRRPIDDRFWSKVDKNGPNGCWLWLGSTREGYGQFCVEDNTPIGAHRVAMFLARGFPILPGRSMQFDHLCRNKRCVNPDHLEYVTAAENVRRSLPFRSKPTPRALRTVCRNGHAYTTENTHWYRGHQQCRACHAASENRRRSLGITTRQLRRKVAA